MKKIIIALALLASVQIAGAQPQVKSLSAAKSAVEKAAAATENAKKATNPATWIALGKAYLDAYAAPLGSGWIGANEGELNLLMSGVPVLETRQQEIGGQLFNIKSYEAVDYYFNQAGQLTVMNTTKPVVEDALDKALDAYKKAYAVDEKAKKTKDIAEGIRNVNTKFTDEAYAAYNLGDMATASMKFEKAADAAAVSPFAQVDTNAIYNAGLTAWMLAGQKEGDEATAWLDRAKSMFQKSIDANYFGEGGEVYAKLADIVTRLGDKEAGKDYLEKGFTAFPQSQSILVGLINYYVSSGDNPGRIFELLDMAKANEPGNASLYYVEGNIHDKLGDEEAAMAAWDKCSEIDPNYEYGYIGKGIHLYNKAVDLQEKASEELDDAKYMALVEQFESALKGCIEPFEKAFDMSRDDEVKASISQFLKNACFRFRADPDYQAKYDKYNSFANGQ